MRAHDCPSCEGLWLSGESFEGICKKKEAQAAASGVKPVATAGVQATLSAANDVNYIPCPICKDAMNRQNFAKVSGVIIDVCKQHGVWLDKHELSLIVHFIESGGMKKASAAHASPSGPHPRKLHASGPHTLARPASGGGSSSLGWDAASILGDVAVCALEIFADSI